MQKKENRNIPSEAGRDEWSVDKLHEQSSNELPDETLRRTLRGNEQKGDGDSRDIVGNVDSNETPQGREEAKKDTEGRLDQND